MITVKKNAAFFILLCIYLLNNKLIYSQICTSYMLVPDTVSINTTTTFEIQPSTGGTTPPSLWLCNWIDFEANGSQECTGIPSCSYTFNTGGLKPVTYQINEPFLGNTEVCTSYVYVNACNASLKAKVNNLTDTIGICNNTNFLLEAHLNDAQSCAGIWQYAWFNGNFYYDGTDFLSINEVWSNNFQNLMFYNSSSNRTFTVKARCSAFLGCKDSSKIYVYIKQNIPTPTFQPLPDTIRCMAGDTMQINVHCPNADSIIYSLNAASVTAGNTINKYTGTLVFDSLYSGLTTITATAFGCNGPKTTTHNINTKPLPTLTVLTNDTTFMCIGDPLTLPVLFTGSIPFELKGHTDSTADTTWSMMLHNSYITYFSVDTSEIILTFFQLKDKYCTVYPDIKHWIFASSKPLLNTLSDTTICADASITLDPGFGTYQYLWLTDSSTYQIITLDTSIAGINMGTNTIYLEVTNEYCILKDTILLTFAVCSSLSEKAKVFDFEIFPNPSSGEINLLLPESKSTFLIEIFNVAGQIIFSHNISLSNTHFKKIKLSDKGVFYIKISNPEGVAVIKKIILF